MSAKARKETIMEPDAQERITKTIAVLEAYESGNAAAIQANAAAIKDLQRALLRLAKRDAG